MAKTVFKPYFLLNPVPMMVRTAGLSLTTMLNLAYSAVYDCQPKRLVTKTSEQRAIFPGVDVNSPGNMLSHLSTVYRDAAGSPATLACYVNALKPLDDANRDIFSALLCEALGNHCITRNSDDTLSPDANGRVTSMCLDTAWIPRAYTRFGDKLMGLDGLPENVIYRGWPVLTTFVLNYAMLDPYCAPHFNNMVTDMQKSKANYLPKSARTLTVAESIDDIRTRITELEKRLTDAGVL